MIKRSGKKTDVGVMEASGLWRRVGLEAEWGTEAGGVWRRVGYGGEWVMEAMVISCLNSIEVPVA